MPSLHFESALLPTGWARDVQVTVADGIIAQVTADTAPTPQDERHKVAVPGMASLHSHAFQRGMAGLAETRGNVADTFWTWRETMYRFALAMTPEEAEAVATLLYVEMLEQGFTRVGEFHYLHHDRDGRHYANIAEMGERIVAAARVLDDREEAPAHVRVDAVARGQEGRPRVLHGVGGVVALLGPGRVVAEEVDGLLALEVDDAKGLALRDDPTPVPARLDHPVFDRRHRVS